MPFGTRSAEQGLLFIITQKLLPSLHNNTSNSKSLSGRTGAFFKYISSERPLQNCTPSMPVMLLMQHWHIRYLSFSCSGNAAAPTALRDGPRQGLRGVCSGPARLRNGDFEKLSLSVFFGNGVLAFVCPRSCCVQTAPISRTSSGFTRYLIQNLMNGCLLLEFNNFQFTFYLNRETCSTTEILPRY